MQIDFPSRFGSVILNDEGQFRPARYFWDFNSSGDGWDSGGVGGLQVSGSIASTDGPWQTDNNHNPPGLCHHTFVRQASHNEQLVNGVIVNPMMFPNASLKMRFRGVGFVSNGCSTRPWVQSRFLGGVTKFTNYFMSSINLSSLLADGDWHEPTISLASDPAAWTYAPYTIDPSDPDYGLLDFAIAQRHVHNWFPLMLTRPVGSSAPSGRIQLDYVDLLYCEKIVDGVVPPTGGWEPILSPVLVAGSSNNSDLVFRGIGSPSQIGGTRARLKVRGHPSSQTAVSRISFGRKGGTLEFAGPPQEVKFNGQSGYTVAAGAELISDELILTEPWQIGDVPIVHLEATSDAQSRTSIAFAGGTYYGAFPGTWNVQSPGGIWSHTGPYFGAIIEIGS